MRLCKNAPVTHLLHLRQGLADGEVGRLDIAVKKSHLVNTLDGFEDLEGEEEGEIEEEGGGGRGGERGGRRDGGEVRGLRKGRNETKKGDGKEIEILKNEAG